MKTEVVLELVAAQTEMQFRKGALPWAVWGFHDGLRGRASNPPHPTQFPTKLAANGAHRRYTRGFAEGVATRRRCL